MRSLFFLVESSAMYHLVCPKHSFCILGYSYLRVSANQILGYQVSTQNEGYEIKDLHNKNSPAGSV